MKVKLTNPALDKGNYEYRVYRGGSGRYGIGFARLSSRLDGDPSVRSLDHGFRLVRNR